MKKSWILLGLWVCMARAEAPKIDIPAQPAAETTNQEGKPEPAGEPISTTVTDPKDKNWKEYDNRIIKVHLRINAAWTLMELKETSHSGTVSFTLSRLPLVTFAVTRDPLQGDFEVYVSSDALTPLYAAGFKKSKTVFAGRKSVLVRGILQDGRQDESYCASDGHSFYRVSFSAPKESWKETQKPFDGIKQSFRWLK